MADTQNPGALAGASGAGIPIQANAEDSKHLSTKCFQRQHHETADCYIRLVAQLTDRWRVIVCNGGIQWVLQQKRGERRGRARWTGVGYFQTRNALIRTSHALCGHIELFAAATLEALPAHISGISAQLPEIEEVNR